MLYGGEAIFGVVDFSGHTEPVRCQADRLVHRATQLGARSGYKTFGAAALGWVDRDFTNDHAHDLSAPVSVAGSLFNIAMNDSTILSRDEKYQWIVEDYKTHGGEFLSRLDGTFALAIWQQDNQRLTLMTDRCGDAHLYYRVDDYLLTFSSWLNLLSSANSEINRQAVHEFLRFFYITAPQTIYTRFRSIEPGRYLTASPRLIECHELGEIGPDAKAVSSAENDAITLEAFGKTFETAIRRRTSGRRVGVFLSSGVDSATLLAGCERINPRRVEAYTVGFDDSELDETGAARAYASVLGVPHAALRFGLKDYRAAFAKMVHELDQPFADPACLPLICAADAVKGEVDVITDGSGSDGLFGASIPRHLRFAIGLSSKLPVAVRKWIGKRLSGSNDLAANSALFDFDDPEELLITWPGWRKCEIEELTGASVSFAESGFYRAFRAHEHASSQQRFEAVGIFPPDDARFEAAAMMNIPIELPYHDVELGAYVRGLPQSLRFEDGASKILLKRLFAKYYPGQGDVLKKRYFTFPLHSFMAADDYAVVRMYLSAEILVRHGLVDPVRVGFWIDRYFSGDHSVDFKIWSLLVLHAWLESRN